MKKLLPAVGLFALAAADASAQLLYDPFTYSAPSSLDTQTNPGNAQPWAKMSSSTFDDDILVTAGSLSYPGLAAAAGNSITYSASGKSQRLGLGDTISSGAAFYSLVFQLTSTSGLSGPTFIAGFSPNSGTSSSQPQTIGTRLYLRPGSLTNTFNIGVSKNSSTSGDIAFDSTDFAVNAPVFVVGSYKINGQDLGTDDEAKLYINPTGFGADAAPTVGAPSSPILTAPAVGTDLFASTPSVAAFLFRQGSTVPFVQADELRVDTTWAQVTPPPGTAWVPDSDGVWSSDANWSPASAPGGSSAFVSFGPVISAARTITLDSGRTVRTLNFNSLRSYTITGSATLTFSGSSAVNVQAGNHIIATPLVLAGDFEASVATAAGLTLSGDLTGNGFSFTKAGAGPLQVKHIRAGNLTIAGGTLKVLSNGGDSGTSVVSGISISSTTANNVTTYHAALDLTNNDLIVHSTPAAKNADFARVVAALRQAAYGPAGPWTGNGITSSTAAANTDLTFALGVILNDAHALDPNDPVAPLYTTFSGQDVDANDILVKFTYFGDADLTGVVDSTDYFLIDHGFNSHLSGWVNGDFDYSGTIDSTDYFLIDHIFNSQQGPLVPASFDAPQASPSSISAVPEPATAELLCATASFLLARRRRRFQMEFTPA